MPEKPLSLNAVVTKHNSLLPHLAKLGLSELRLLSFCLAHYDSRPESRIRETTEDGFPIPQEYFTLTAKVADLTDIFPGMDKNSAYAVVRHAVKGINAKPYEERHYLPDGSSEDVLFYWFSGFRYNNDRGQFTFSLSSDIVNLILSLDGNFTRYRLKNVYQFKSALTWKLYESLKRWLTKGRWEAELDELRILIGVPGKYPVWDNFKKWVLDKSIKEINELSDITVKYEKKKRVRAVSGVVFFINSKEEEERANNQSIVAIIGDMNSDIQRLMHYGVTQPQAEIISRLAKDAGRDIGPNLEKITTRYETKSPEERGPKGAYIFNALKSEFTPTLFDSFGKEHSVKTLTPDEQRKIAQEHNKAFLEVMACKNYERRERGEECKSINPRTKKCKWCDRIVKK